MYALRPGAVSPQRSLGAMLRQVHDDNRQRTLDEIKQRTSQGVPLDDGDGPLVDPGEYKGSPDLDGVMVSFRSVSAADVAKAELAISAAIEADSNADLLRAMRCYVSAIACNLNGLADEDGAFGIDVLTPAAMDTIESAGLLLPLYQACKVYQYLPGAKKKIYGSAQPLTSVDFSARPASRTSEKSTAATATQLAPSPSRQNTEQTPALAVLSDESHSLAPSSATTTQQAAS